MSVIGNWRTFPALKYVVTAALIAGCSNTRMHETVISRPETLSAILSNTYAAWRNDIFIVSPLSENKMLAISGGRNIVWIQQSDKWQYASVHGFDKVVKPLVVGKDQISGLDYLVSRRESTSIKTTIFFHPVKPALDLSFGVVTHIMGQNWKTYSSNILEVGRVYDPSINKHGNESIKYEFNDVSFLKAAIIEFNADGTLYQANFEEESRR